MRRRLALLLVALSMVACGPETAPEPDGPVSWSVATELGSDRMEVGESVALTLVVTHPPGSEFVPPTETSFEPFEVLETEREVRAPTETAVRYRLGAFFLPRDVEVPPLELGYVNEAGEVAVLETEALAVSVVSSLTPQVTDIHDIKDAVPLELPRDYRLLFWLLAALLAALVAYLLYRKLRREPEDAAAPRFVAPLVPPDVEAEAALDALVARKRIEKGDVELFYTELTDIMKRYAGRRFDVAYLERTTGEMLFDLGRKRVASDKLRRILEASDLVKFARETPSVDDARASLRAARELIRETRHRPTLERTA